MHKTHKPTDSENKMVLHALMAANAISRTPITPQTIKEAKEMISRVEELWLSAVGEQSGVEESVLRGEYFQ